jgi:hypothetical protein
VGALAPVPVPGSECDWEWERRWKLLALALARKRDTILRTLSLRRTARVDFALLDRPGRLDCLAVDRRVGLPCRDSWSAVVRFWESTVCLEEIQIDPAICDGVWIVVDVVAVVVVVVVVVADGKTAAAHYSILAQEAAVVLLDRSSTTSRRCEVSNALLWYPVIGSASYRNVRARQFLLHQRRKEHDHGHAYIHTVVTHGMTVRRHRGD